MGIEDTGTLINMDLVVKLTSVTPRCPAWPPSTVGQSVVSVAIPRGDKS
jgi:hypothetical protein